MAQVGADANWNRDKAPEYPAAAGNKVSTDAHPAVDGEPAPTPGDISKTTKISKTDP